MLLRNADDYVHGNGLAKSSWFPKNNALLSWSIRVSRVADESHCSFWVLMAGHQQYPPTICIYLFCWGQIKITCQQPPEWLILINTAEPREGDKALWCDLIWHFMMIPYNLICAGRNSIISGCRLVVVFFYWHTGICHRLSPGDDDKK